MSTNSVSALDQVMQTIDLGPTGSLQLMFAKLQMAQGMICKAQAEDYMDQIEQIQKDQQECADMIAKARELQNAAKNGEGDCSWDDEASMMPQEMADYFDAHGLSYDKTGGDLANNEEEWDYNIQSLTNYQETIGNETQTLMVYLQDFISQYNSYMQGASSAISEAGDVLTALATGR